MLLLLETSIRRYLLLATSRPSYNLHDLGSLPLYKSGGLVRQRRLLGEKVALPLSGRPAPSATSCEPLSLYLNPSGLLYFDLVIQLAAFVLFIFSTTRRWRTTTPTCLIERFAPHHAPATGFVVERENAAAAAPALALALVPVPILSLAL